MHRLTKIFSNIFLAVLVLPLAGQALAKGDLSPATPATVGEVSLTLGKATILNAQGHAVPAVVGLPIHAGDTIETGRSGFVHIRFVDDALVTVRSSSTLEVVRYDYNAKNPQNSAVKFNLVEGVTRAISGQAAKQARQNFRMNTPIAAIGVRGTDFAVSANNQTQTVRAIVNEGSIVMAPFSSQCSVDALGPCSQNASELSGLSRQILEMKTSTSGISSVLLPATNAQAQALVAEASAKADSTSKATKAADNKDLYTDTVTSRAVNTTLANNEAIKPPVETVTPPPVIVVPPPSPEFTPAVAETSAALTTNTQLVWGRWTEGSVGNDRITVPYDVAIQNDRKVAVGDFIHALFRSEPAAKSMQSGLGVLAFNLNKAQAQYTSGGQTSLMQVNGGQLSLDFNQSKFSTSLQLNHAATGNVSFEDSGGFDTSGGYFHTDRGTQSMAGAVSLDGKEAGYFFEKALTNGSVQGLTLWSQKP